MSAPIPVLPADEGLPPAGGSGTVGAAFGSPFDSPALVPPAWHADKDSGDLASHQTQHPRPPSPTGRLPPAAGASGRPHRLDSDRQNSLSIRVSRNSLGSQGDGALGSPIPRGSSSAAATGAHTPQRRPAVEVWGWLQPCRPTLPHVLLQGQGVLLGRGRDTIEERLLPPLPRTGSSQPVGEPGLQPRSSWGLESLLAAVAPPPSPANGSSPSHAGASASSPGVGPSSGSRGHGDAGPGGAKQAVFVEDVSSNGTFLNGAKIARARRAPLSDGDKVSLVLSVAPLAEQAWVFRRGDPRTKDAKTVADWIEDAARMWAEPNGSGEPGSPRVRRAATRLRRTATSTYTTADDTTTEDLQCTICLCTLRDAVALEPCGHSYCAVCLSNHFAALLGGGQPLSCPLRCAPPERVIANTIVRGLARTRAAPAAGASMRSRRHSSSSLLSPVPEWFSVGDVASSAEVSSPSARDAPAGADSPHRLQTAAGADEAAAAAAGSCPPMPIWLQLRLAEGLESTGAQAEACMPRVVGILSAAGQLPSPDAEGTAELDLRQLRSATLWALCEAVLGSVVAENELAAAMAATAMHRAVRHSGGGRQGSPTSASGSPFAFHETREEAGAAGSSGANHQPATSEAASTFCGGSPVGSANYSSALAALEAAQAAAAAPPGGGWGSGVSPGGGRAGAGAAEELLHLLEEEEAAHMNPLCPLHDELLPLDAGSLKSRQLAFSVQQLQDATLALDAAGAMEAMARLAWSDDVAREELAREGAIDCISAAMEEFPDDEGVACTAALALMALVRGDGEASAANKQRVAAAGGVESVVDAMQARRERRRRQAKRARIADVAIPSILGAVQRHLHEPEVVGKALVLLGVMAQGEEPMHDAVREEIVAAGAGAALARVLREQAVESEEVLWAVLFLLAVLLREASPLFVRHVLSLAAGGMLPALRSAMAAYHGRVNAQARTGLGLSSCTAHACACLGVPQEVPEDEMVTKAGAYLVDVFERAQRVIWLRRSHRVMQVVAYGLIALSALRLARSMRRRIWRSHTPIRWR
eukprot:scaffold9.g3054.t1